MAGGLGTRLDADREKPLVRVGGRPMVDRVIDALRVSGVERVYAATSPHAPATREHVSVPAIETPGEGYVADLEAVLTDDRIDRPVLTVVADLPLLAPDAVDDVLAAHETGSLTVAVPAGLKERLGVSADTTFDRTGREVAPAGLNVVGDGPDRTLVVEDPRLAVNVNRPGDLTVARNRA
ncbi:NTP transferase domain-containing protein [Halomicrobium salinisoli]|uniref:NTP transferase domain-containing protein n=1 Tax=Halomicrobium salinisoli TaxID=2878391 RepID=UPI001CF0C5F3|nr:NTP transferase domain-containing protein [Halomicrobium salinisoli]